MGGFILGVLAFTVGAVILIAIAGLCTWIAAAVLRSNSDQTAIMFICALIGSIAGHYFIGAWGPGILDIYFLPALAGSFAGMVLVPIAWMVFTS